jgi:DnaJ domain
MQDLYSILGVSRRANSAQIKAAYRLKAKLFHPDLHASDKEAEKRIQEINYAYTILRKPRARTAYDRKLGILRMRTRRRWGAIATAALASFTITMTTISLMWRREAGNPPLAGYQASVQHNSARERSLIAETPEGHAITALVEARRHHEVASSGELTSVPADPRPGKTEIADIAPPHLQTERPVVPRPASVQEPAPQTNSTGTEKLDQNSARSIKVLSSSGESDSVGKSSPSDFAMSGDKSGMKRRDTADINTNDVKISNMKLPETNMPGSAQMAAKLQATSRTNVEQASLENRNTCSKSQSCSRAVPPLFGVGF